MRYQERNENNNFRKKISEHCEVSIPLNWHMIVEDTYLNATILLQKPLNNSYITMKSFLINAQSRKHPYSTTEILETYVTKTRNLRYHIIIEA